MSDDSNSPEAFPIELSQPPHMIYDESDRIIGAILAYSDYKKFLSILAKYSDWEELPRYLQDAIDNMLADEAEAESSNTRPLRELLSETSEHS